MLKKLFIKFISLFSTAVEGNESVEVETMVSQPNALQLDYSDGSSVFGYGPMEHEVKIDMEGNVSLKIGGKWILQPNVVALTFDKMRYA